MSEKRQNSGRYPDKSGDMESLFLHGLLGSYVCKY